MEKKAIFLLTAILVTSCTRPPQSESEQIKLTFLVTCAIMAVTFILTYIVRKGRGR